MSDEANATDETPRASEAEALASLREYALGPISAVFTWSEAATVLDLIEMLTKSGIIEVAIRNPSVAEYMAHWEGRAEKAEAVIEAQSKALAEARVVRPLEWHMNNGSGYAASVVGEYQIREFDGVWWRLALRGSGLTKECISEDEAKADAQSDYQQRILSALTPTPENPNG